MNTWMGEAIWRHSLALVDLLFEYRFLKKMFGTKYRHTFVWFYLGSFIYGYINRTFVLAGTTLGNFIYLSLCGLALNMLLFHGSAVKKIFFTLWMYCAPELAFCSIFPLVHTAAVDNGLRYCPDAVLDVMSYVSCVAQYLMMEILLRRLHLLRRDFSEKDAFYLMYIIVFIYAAVITMTDLFLGVGDWAEGTMFPVAVCCSLVAAAGTGLHLFCVIMLERRLLERLAEQQYTMLSRHLEAAGEQYDQLRKMRHDMKNHGLCLAHLLADGKAKEAAHYLEELDIRTDQVQAAVETGSIYADALLNPKYQQARKLGIDISIRISVPGEDRLASADLCCILANALDNAVEACERGLRAGEAAGWIRMYSRMHPNYWVLEIRNSIHEPVAVEHGRIRSSKRLQFHRQPAYGVGLQNIRAAVERYEGVMEVKTGKEFSLNIMLPMESQ